MHVDWGKHSFAPSVRLVLGLRAGGLPCECLEHAVHVLIGVDIVVAAQADSAGAALSAARITLTVVVIPRMAACGMGALAMLQHEP